MTESPSHTVQEYEEQLEALRERLLGMASRVENMISRSIEALTEGNVELAEQTIEEDKKVNSDEMETDRLCLVILAKRQPMASDLRFISIGLKMVTDLERIGDLAVNICLEAIDQQEDYDDSPPLDDVPAMGDIVQGMVKAAIDSFVDEDADAARQVIQQDDTVDEMYNEINRELIEYMRETDNGIEAATGVQSVAKHLERMADHTTNLAEQVIFMVEGEDVRHQDKLAENWKQESGRS